MIGWILAGLAAATVYTAVKENEGGNNGNTSKEGNKSTAQTKKQGVSPSWEVKTISMSEYPPSMDVKPYMTDNFYIGSYLCPCCRNNMYKTVFRMGGEEYISVNGNMHIMKRLFTCPHCLSFYAPIEGHRLSDGSVYFLQCKYSEDYIPLISHYNSVGTTQGRPDA